MLKAVLFDLDNTLYDYDAAHKVAMKSVVREMQKHHSISGTDFMKLFDMSRKEIHRELSGTASAHNRILYFQRTVEKTHANLEPDIVLALYDAYWNTLLKNIRLRKNAIDVLKFCRDNGIKTAIVSDLTTKIQLRKIKKLGISRYIDVLVTSEEAGSEKPHAIMFLLTLNKLGVAPHDSVMVGDNAVADIEGANFVGLTTVLLKKGVLARGPKEDYQKPDYTISSISKLIGVIEKLNKKTEGYIKFDCHFNKTKPVSKKHIKDLNIYRQKLFGLGLIGAYPDKVGYGNLSIKKGKNIIITGTATGNLSELDESGYSLITSYDIHANNVFCSGAVKASSESMTHAALYECDRSIGAVIHIHNLVMWKKYLDVLPTTSCKAEYGTPEMAFEIQRLYHRSDFRKKKIAVLCGHKEGLIVFGSDIKEAFDVIIKYFDKL